MCKLMEEFAEKYAEEYAEKREAKGRAEGKLEGIATGTIRGKMTTIRNMLSKGINLEEALALAELDKKTYEDFSQANL